MLGSRFEFGFDGTKKHQQNCRAKKKKMHPMHMRCLPVIWLTHYVWSMKHISEQGWLNFNGIKIWCLLIRIKSGWWYCWWFRNPANQLRLVVEIPMIYSYRVSKTSQVGFRRISEPSTVSLTCLHHLECIKPCRYIMGKKYLSTVCYVWVSSVL